MPVVRVVIPRIALQRPPRGPPIPRLLDAITDDCAAGTRTDRRPPIKFDDGLPIGGGPEVTGGAGIAVAGRGVVGDAFVGEFVSLVARDVLDASARAIFVVNPYSVASVDRIVKRQDHLVASDPDSVGEVIGGTYMDDEAPRARFRVLVEGLVVGQDEFVAVHGGILQLRLDRVDFEGLAVRGVALVHGVGLDPDRQGPVVVVIGCDVEVVLIGAHFVQIRNRTIGSDFDIIEIEAGDIPREPDRDRELTVRGEVLVRGDRPNARHAGGSGTPSNVPESPPLHTHRPLTIPILEGRLLRLRAGWGKKDHTRRNPRHPCTHLAHPLENPGGTASGVPGCRGRAARARSSDAATDLTRII